VGGSSGCVDAVMRVHNMDWMDGHSDTATDTRGPDCYSRLVSWPQTPGAAWVTTAGGPPRLATTMLVMVVVITAWQDS
jgi:hypothetical protein